MNVKAKKESRQPLSVLGCIMGGFETLGHTIWPIIFPLLLDVFLWLGPRLSISPLANWFVAFAKASPTTDPEVAYQLAQATQMVEQFGKEFNLFSLLSILPLLNIPSLLSRHMPGALSPLGERLILSINSLFGLIGWGIVLIPAGLVMGFLYINAVSRSVQHECAASEEAQREETGKTPTTLKPDAASSIDGHPRAERPPDIWGMSTPFSLDRPGCSMVLKVMRTLLFIILLGVMGGLLIPIWLLMLSIATSIAPIVGMVTWAFSLGVTSYLLLHLFFVMHGILSGGRNLLQAILESIMLTRMNFFSTVLLVILGLLIYYGLSFIWSLPAGDSWTLLIGILCNSGIATALTSATFIFYREHIYQLTHIRSLAVAKDT